MRPPDREQKARLAKLSADQVSDTELGGGADHREADHRARQWCAAGRAEGDDRQRLVRGAAFRHRGRVQDLRRIVPRTRSILADVQRAAQQVVDKVIG